MDDDYMSNIVYVLHLLNLNQRWKKKYLDSNSGSDCATLAHFLISPNIRFFFSPIITLLQDSSNC